MAKKKIQAWARRSNKGISFAYGFRPFPDNRYAEIAPTKKQAIKQWGKDDIMKVEIKILSK